MAVMTDKRVRYLPVIDEEKLIGIISIGDWSKTLLVTTNSPSTS
jgi:predicted transcriptional regulator